MTTTTTKPARTLVCADCYRDLRPTSYFPEVETTGVAAPAAATTPSIARIRRDELVVAAAVLTVEDIEAGYADDRYLGHGYLGGRGLETRTAAAASSSRARTRSSSRSRTRPAGRPTTSSTSSTPSTAAGSPTPPSAGYAVESARKLIVKAFEGRQDNRKDRSNERLRSSPSTGSAATRGRPSPPAAARRPRGPAGRRRPLVALRRGLGHGQLAVRAVAVDNRDLPVLAPDLVEQIEKTRQAYALFVSDWSELGDLVARDVDPGSSRLDRRLLRLEPRRPRHRRPSDHPRLARRARGRGQRVGPMTAADLTLVDAAAELGLDPSTLRQQLASGRLRGRKVGPGPSPDARPSGTARRASAGQAGRRASRPRIARDGREAEDPPRYVGAGPLAFVARFLARVRARLRVWLRVRTSSAGRFPDQRRPRRRKLGLLAVRARSRSGAGAEDATSRALGVTRIEAHPQRQRPRARRSWPSATRASTSWPARSKPRSGMTACWPSSRTRTAGPEDASSTIRPARSTTSWRPSRPSSVIARPAKGSSAAASSPSELEIARGRRQVSAWPAIRGRAGCRRRSRASASTPRGGNRARRSPGARARRASVAASIQGLAPRIGDPGAPPVAPAADLRRGACNA